MGMGACRRQEGLGLCSFCLPVLPARRHGETSLQMHYSGELLFQGSRLPLLDCRLPQGQDRGYQLLASLEAPPGAPDEQGCSLRKCAKSSLRAPVSNDSPAQCDGAEASSCPSAHLG